MFKAVRWRSEKNKINAVFKLSFHATQVLQFGESALVLSLVPADTGKPTAKLDKYEIRDDCCYWESPIFETVKLVQDPKNGKIHDRIYYFIISTGSSKSSIVGEASVNFSEYAEATKSASIALPFKSLNSDVVLHVSIQRIQENVNQREVEEHKAVAIKPEDRSLKGHFGKGDSEENTNTNYDQGKPLTKTVLSMVELNGNGRASIGSDITLSGSDNSSGLDTPQELGIKSNDILMDTQHASIAQNQQGTGWEWSLTTATHDSSPDDSTNSQRDALDDSVEKLKSDLILLSRKADFADLELQTLRKQIVKENKKGQDLLKEVALLKEERDAFKEECERLKASHKARNNMNYEGNPWDLLEETRQELNHEKDLNANLRLQLHMTQESNSELILAVQDLEQLLEQANRGDLDLSIQPVTCNISEKLEGRALEGQAQISDDDEQKALEKLVKQHSEAKEAYILEQKIMDLYSEIELYRRDKDELEMQMEQLALDYEILKQENHDMSYKLEQSHLQQQLKLQYEFSGSYAAINELENQVEMLEREVNDRSDELSDSLDIIKDLENHNQSLGDELDKQAHQFKSGLEDLVSAKIEKEQQAIQAEEVLRSARCELENRIETLESELQKQSTEFSDALSTIKELEGHIQNLEEELDKQAQGFESDLEAITRAKVEQEQRAIRAEEALRLTRCKNANTAERIQDEFKRLSRQMQSTFEANENVATKAMTEASHLRFMNNHLEELLQQARDELQSVKESNEAQLSDLRKQLSLKLVEIEEKSNQLEAQREHEDEACRCLSAELLMVKAEVDRLTSDTASLRAQIEHGEELRAELEQVKALVKERDLLFEKAKWERDNLESVVDSTKKEAAESLNELNMIRCLKDEKDMDLKNFDTEVGTLRAQCEEMRHSVFEDEEKLRKQVFQLKTEIKKKDDALATMERKLKDNNGRTIAADRANLSSKNSKAELASCSSKEATSLKERIQLLEVNGYSGDSHILNGNDTDTAINRNGEVACIINSGDEHGIDALLKEMTCLREEKSFMEAELQEMQERYSDISLKFAEVEGERQRLVMTLRNVKNTKKS